MKRFAIFGASGFGREIMPLARQQLQLNESQPWDLTFVDDNPENNHINGHEVITYEKWLSKPAISRQICIGIANGVVREKLVERCKNDSVNFFNIVS